jgi:hypothetical protein
MRSFLRNVIGFFLVILFPILMVLTTIAYLLFNSNYYIYSLRRPGVYKNIQKGLKITVGDFLKRELSSQGTAYENMKVSERQVVDQEINNLLAPISEDNIKDLSEINIVRLTNYINGSSPDLIVYLPIQKWGLESTTLEQLPDYIKTENINIQNLAYEHPELKINIENINNFEGLGKKIRLYWLISLILLTGVVAIHVLSGDKKYKFIQSGRLITASGLIILFIAWLFKVAQNTFGQNIAIRSSGYDILMGTIISTLLNYIFILWLVSAISLILIGLLMFNIKTKETSK